MPKNKRLHFKELDALRFFAMIPLLSFTVLFLTRTENEGFHQELFRYFKYLRLNSFDFYFFLSSFLLTSHALREYKYYDSFSLKKFYWRRLVRIIPLFTVILIFALFFYELILKTLKLTEAVKFINSKYLELIPGYYTSYGNEQYIYLSVIWTVLMFLTFYFLWGIVMKYLKNNLVYVIYTLVGLGIILRIIFYYNDLQQPFNLLLYFTPIAFGAYLALAIRNEFSILAKIKTTPKKLIGPIYIVGILIILTNYLFLDNAFAYALIPAITCTFFSFIIIDQTFGKNSLFKMKNSKLLSRLGKINFGLFVYHSIISVLVIIGVDSIDYDINSIATKLGISIVVIIMTWIVADLSYNFFERPLLSFKREIK